MTSPNEKEKEIQEVENEQEKLDIMEKDFHRVLQSFFADHSMDRFREEYEKMYETLIESHKNNNQLIIACKELNNSILANANKVSSVLTLSQNDQKTIAGLRHEFEKAWKMVDVSQEREARSKEAIENLKIEIAHLSRTVEQGGALSLAQSASLDETKDRIAQIRKEIKVQEAQVVFMKQELEQKENEKNCFNQAIDDLKKEQLELDNEFQEEIGKTRVLGNEIVDMKRNLMSLKEQAIGLKKKSAEIDEQIEKQRVENSKLVEMVDELKHSESIFRDDLQDRGERYSEAGKRLERERENQQKILASIAKYERLIECRDRVVNEYKSQMEKINIEHEEHIEDLNYEKDYRKQLQKQKIETFDKLKRLRSDVVRLGSKETTSVMNNQGKILEIEKEKRAGLRIKNKLLDKENEAEFIKQNRMHFATEILTLKTYAHEDRAKMTLYEEEINKYTANYEEAKGLKKQIDDEVRHFKYQNDQMLLNLNELTQHVNRQETLNESIHKERDNLARQAKDAQREKEAVEADNQTLTNNIAYLKNSIKKKDKVILEMHIKQKITKSQCITLRNDIKHKKFELKELDNLTTEIRNKIQRSHFFLSESDLDRKKHCITNNELESSSRMIENSTIKKKRQIEALTAQAKLVSCLIDKCSDQYKKKLEEIENEKEVLMFECERTRKLMNRKSHMKALKCELIRMQRSLVEEMGKAKAMEIEIEKPMSVHRWRFYDATNPEMGLLLRMKMTLGDKLMVLIYNCERLIQIKNALAAKNEIHDKHLQNSYGGNFEEEKMYYLDLLRSKTRMLAHMQHQASNQQNNISDHKEQLLTVRTLVREEKAEFHETKKKVVKIRAKTAIEKRRMPLQPTTGNEIRFVGGGFVVGGIKPTTTTQITASPMAASPMLNTIAPQSGAPMACPMGTPIHHKRHKTKPKTHVKVQRVAKTRLEEVVPDLILPSRALATPRRMEDNSARKKKVLPSGWNPSRPPISPFIPTALGTVT
ncbi:coiled-coil domain containing 147 [Tritrichomonas foetus]|uniref:Coiled-coil domain containing 147 n=1 Tax=Tritrichomonas foetus TaxID=1144522 RepID=A0A1J4KY72_9EUKA|nr:coiled-coil domain containing 147 [Tritrichomonas foetus]|eukprot:OHT14501.1 coiled-coil domain containing 147 [Tritrichomonas foetus]